MHKPSSLLVAAAMLATLGACSDPPPLDVDGGFLRLNPNPNAPSAAYFTIHGGADDVVLRDVLTDEAVRVEIHESSTKDGVASMRPVKTVDVPAGATVKFEPGGKHLMLWSINPQALEDKKMTFTFIFSNGQRILADAIVQQPGAAGEMAGMEDHSGH
ncbi:copper(I)-binding protein [Sphingobium sp. B1D7B]|uniref:copper chaperone PCu(A)C n=1 Tax=unclassified Sphingobium TaxID=2611147 RepID=UPI002224090C|nr:MULTISPECIES: copper chaperone PCu(A)C [unclassified Sphingobium]MCW2393358.1 copper(I)-binding protein [Sphingobium sp. B11D3A]MCW2405295.1 copper(I)-binding protein [Sphingobium sp. B1D7B]